MLSVREITKLLPPPRDDEPSSLREDIADEILDHLQCGLRRELLIHGGEESHAKQRVLDQFGDPRQVARKLWYQAMWNKIMIQRLVIGGTVFSMLMTTALVVMLGLLVRQMQQQQQINVALVEKLGSLTNPSANPLPQRDLHWNNLKVRVSKGSDDGPAAEGFVIQVLKQPMIGENVTGIRGDVERTIDESGVADCGFVEQGVYDVLVTTPWNESAKVTFTIHPGRDHLERIVVPDTAQFAGVSFQVQGMPDSPSNQKDALLIMFQPTGSRKFANHKWQMRDGACMIGDSMPYLLLIPDHGLWIAEISKENCGAFEPQIVRNAKWKPFESSSEFRLPASRYAVLFSLISFKHTGGFSDQTFRRVSPADPRWQKSIEADSRPHFEVRGLEQVAERERTNHWAIEVPKEVVDRFNPPDPDASDE